MLRVERVATTGTEPPVDLELAAGEAVVLIGPSGGTRSRLLHVVAGDLRPHAGRVLLDGAPVRPPDVGLVDEDRSLVGGLTAVENVVTRALAHGPLRPGAWSAAGELLRSLDLPESSLHNLAEQLSGGQQQRVALGRALFGEPPVLCLDDPVSELDGASAALVWSRIAEAVDRGAALLVGLPEPDPAVPAGRIVDVGHPIAGARTGSALP